MRLPCARALARGSRLVAAVLRPSIVLALAMWRVRGSARVLTTWLLLLLAAALIDASSSTAAPSRALDADPAAARSASAAVPNIALYYAADLPVDELRAFDIVVVEPDHGFDPRKLDDGRTKFFAYVSVGEALPTRSYYARLDPQWKIGENRTWGSTVIDQSSEAWQRFFVEEIIGPLWAKGYRGFFLDTLDSYYLVDDKVQPWSRQVEGTAALIKQVAARYPGIALLFNRGFEIVPKVRSHVHTVVVESLFQSWNADAKRYVETSEKDHRETLAELVRVRDELKLPVLVIDYVPPADRELARRTAERIRALGFMPYITTPDLDMVGLGNIEVQPRKVLVVIDKRDAPDPRVVILGRFPGHIDPALRRFGKARQRVAIDRVNGNAFAGRDDADDTIPRQGMTATRVMNRHARNEAADRYRV